ncbi:MAG TPA: cytochrome c [Isosphaeraceae bacterium]|jgi:cytochrome c556|nr:cytochrome c [Isosphaeraceae bacterium]
MGRAETDKNLLFGIVALQMDFISRDALVAAMSAAAEAHDLAALRAAHRRIATSCKACHDAHRARRGG